MLKILTWRASVKWAAGKACDVFFRSYSLWWDKVVTWKAILRKQSGHYFV
jgi:hypothetical protein